MGWSKTRRPARSPSTRSKPASKSGRCRLSSKARGGLASSSSRINSSLARRGSRLAKGSSARSSSGSCRSSRARATRWRWPPERAETGWLSRAGSRSSRCNIVVQALVSRGISRLSRARGQPQTASRAALRFCCTVSSSIRRRSCQRVPIRACCRRRARPLRARASPCQNTLPCCGVSKPLATASKVLLPAPLGPSRAIRSPASTCSDTRSRRGWLRPLTVMS